MSLPIALFVFGAVLFTTGLIGRVKAKELEIGTESRWIRMVSLLERAISIVNVDPEVTTLFARGRSIAQSKADTMLKLANIYQAIGELGEMDFLGANRFGPFLMEAQEEMKRSEKELRRYQKDWEEMRIKLTQKYNRQFAGTASELEW